MIDALIQGRVHGKPQDRTGASGKAFTVAKLRAADANGEALFVDVVAFSNTARAALLALDEGESAAIAGPITVRVWIDKEGNPHPSLSVVAHHVTTPYHVRRKRQATAPEGDSTY